MRPLLALLLVAALLLSGCASKGGDDATSTPTASASTSSTASGTSSATGSTSSTGTGAPPNRAPTGAITAAVNGTAVAFNLTGSDPDGDALSWTLSFGDGNQTSGTSLPAAANHTFAAGNYTATYNVTDGKLSASYNVSLAIAASAAAPAGPVFSASGSYSAGGPGQACSPIGALYTLGPDDGVTHSQIDVPAEAGGQPYTVTVDATAPSAGITVSYAEGGSINGGDTNFPSPNPTSLSSTIPEATTTLIISTCGGGLVEWSLVVG